MGRLLLWAFILFGAWVCFKVLTGGASLTGAIQGPQTLVNESVILEEGRAMGYGFALTSERRVQVKVTSTPVAVNVMLMSEQQWKEYQRVKGKLFGGQYHYIPSLSSQGITAMDKDEALAPGSYRIVVERPQESLLFADSATASVLIISH